MQLIFSIFVCLALAFGGGGEFSAAPERASAWTARDIHISGAFGEYELEPELYLRAAVGAERADLRFKAESGGRARMPLSLRVAPGEMLLSLSDSGRAYRLTDLEDWSVDIAPEAEAPLADVLMDLGALIGACRGDAERAQNVRAACERALTAVGGEQGRVEAVWDGRGYDADCTTAELRAEELPALLDAQRDGGAPELEALADGASALVEALPGPEEGIVALSSISFAEGELRYAEQRMQWSAGDSAAQLRWIETENPSHWSVIWTLKDGDETAQHVDLTSFGDSGRASVQLDDLRLEANWSRAAEDAWAVEGTLRLGEDRCDYSLELAHEEIPAPDDFAGAELYDVPDSDAEWSEQDSILEAALAADTYQFALEAMQLCEEPGIAAMLDDFGGPEEAVEADDDDESYRARTVATLEEAAAIYEGELPDYRAPGGWEIDEIEVSPTSIHIHYSGARNGFTLWTFTSGNTPVLHYTCSDGAMAPAREYAVIFGAEGSRRRLIEVYPPEGGLSFRFDFDETPTMDELQSALSGLGASENPF